MADELTAIIKVNISAQPGVGLFADCATLAECAMVQNSLLASGSLDLHELLEAGVPQAFVSPNYPTPAPRPENQPSLDWGLVPDEVASFDWGPIIEPFCR